MVASSAGCLETGADLKAEVSGQDANRVLSISRNVFRAVDPTLILLAPRFWSYLKTIATSAS